MRYRAPFCASGSFLAPHRCGRASPGVSVTTVKFNAKTIEIGQLPLGRIFIQPPEVVNPVVFKGYGHPTGEKVPKKQIPRFRSLGPKAPHLNLYLKSAGFARGR